MGLKKPLPDEALREVVVRSRSAEGLLAQLVSPDVTERRWAARDLSEHPEATAQLGQALQRERDPSVLEALLTSLGKIGTVEAVEALLPLLRSEEPFLRNGAIESLSGMGEAVALRIGAMLNDVDPDVRIFTVNLLGDLKHPDLPNWLAQVLQDEEQVNVVAAAIEVLAEVGGPTEVPALREAALRFPDDPFVGFAVDMAISRIEAP